MNDFTKDELEAYKNRFEKYFIKSSNCWHWEGGKNGNGYGSLMNIYGKFEVAHRISYKLYNGEIPEGILVLHKCDIRHCVNPNHLFLGTHKDNTDDMVKKGRHGGYKNNFKGSKNPNSKINEKDKKTIIASLLNKKNTQKELAQIYGVHRQAIWRVCKEHGLIKKFRQGWAEIGCQQI